MKIVDYLDISINLYFLFNKEDVVKDERLQDILFSKQFTYEIGDEVEERRDY